MMKRKTTLKIASAAALLAALSVAYAVHQRQRTKRIARNESRIIAHLKNLGTAQAQFVDAGARDADGNGTGKYGDFYELRSVLGAEWSKGSRTRVRLDGYLVEIHLHADTTDRETSWSAYAWPASYGHTGLRAFAISKTGDVASSPNRRTQYSGLYRAPARAAACLPPEPTTGQLWPAVNQQGTDHEQWSLI